MPEMLRVQGPDVTNGFRDPSFTLNRQYALHRWVPWIAGFSAEFVNDCLRNYLPGRDPSQSLVLDPFAGVGTTLVEALLHGYNVVGFEINPYAALASRVKLRAAGTDVSAVAREIKGFKRFMDKRCSETTSSDPRTVPPDGFSGRTELFSPAVQRKALFALDYINNIDDESARDLFRLAFGSVMVSFSNYSYEPSLTRRVAVGKKAISDHDVANTITLKLDLMLGDIEWLQDHIRSLPKVPEGKVIPKTIFEAADHLGSGSVDGVITSPPYLNNYHYPRNTRPQLHWLGLASGRGYGGANEKESFGKFWQTVRDLPPISLAFEMPEMQATIDKIRIRNTDKEQYGGAGWANYVATYFNDTYKFCRVLKRLLKRDGAAVIVLGNSIIQGVEVKTDQVFGQIGELCGLRFDTTLLLRKKRTGTSIITSSVRVDAATDKTVLYESAVVLRKR